MQGFGARESKVLSLSWGLHLFRNPAQASETEIKFRFRFNSWVLSLGCRVLRNGAAEGLEEGLPKTKDRPLAQRLLLQALSCN